MAKNMLSQYGLADNIADRLKRNEYTLNDILSNGLTSSSPQGVGGDEGAGFIGNWMVSGGALRDKDGLIVLDPDGPYIQIGAGGRFYSSDYVANTSGFNIDGGTAEFNDVTVRGTIYADVGEIGGWTIAADGIKSALAGARIEMKPTGISGYDATTRRFFLDSSGSGYLGSQDIFSWTTAGVVSLNGSAVMPNTITGGKVNYFNVPIIDGLAITNNSPAAGRVAWSSFTLTHKGTSYTITAGNTPLSTHKFVYWNKATSTTVLQTSITPPARAVDQFIILFNESGVGKDALFENIVYSDYISVVNLAAINANIGAAHIDGVLDIGTSGGIYQGTGTFAAPTTGLKIYNSGGIGQITGYNAGVAQSYFNTDGKFYAGGGNVVLDASGISLVVGTAAASQIKWYDGANLKARIHAEQADALYYLTLYATDYVTISGGTEVRMGKTVVSGNLDVITGDFSVSGNSNFSSSTARLYNGSAYTNTMTVGQYDGTTFWGSYFNMNGRDYSGGSQYGWMSFVADSNNANASSGQINFYQMTAGPTFNLRMAILKGGQALFYQGPLISVADAGVALRLAGATGRLRVYGYYDATLGAAIQALNTAESGYVPMTLDASTVSIRNSGLHVGGTSDPGNDNLAVDGTISINGASITNPPFQWGGKAVGVAASGADADNTTSIARATTINKVTWLFNVATTNNATNYWTIEIRRGDTDAVLTSLSTAAYAADTWHRIDTTPSIAITTSMLALYMYYTKTNSPGNMTVYPCVIGTVY